MRTSRSSRGAPSSSSFTAGRSSARNNTEVNSTAPPPADVMAISNHRRCRAVSHRYVNPHRASRAGLLYQRPIELDHGRVLHAAPQLSPEHSIPASARLIPLPTVGQSRDPILCIEPMSHGDHAAMLAATRWPAR
ncbi:hypothetical protein [Opitutus terrae]|uniref:hypothetical protein n=1 Tax=Opitutus terrae TaxID=107709 RepID=UPI0011D06BA2|nr:hypothetical protein [Opitutus terrae]